MNNKFLFIVSLIFLLLLAGLGSFNSGILLLSVAPIIYVIAAYINKPDEPLLNAERILSTECETERNPVTVKIRMENTGNKISAIYIIDFVPEGLTVINGKSQLFKIIAPGETFDLTYTVSPRRGHHRFKYIEARIVDPFGLFEHQTLKDAPGYLLSRPQKLKLHSLKIRSPQTRGFAGPIPSRKGGVGIDFFSIREYQPGDPLRWINWKVSARHFQELFTTSYEQERIADAGIILDARERSNVKASTNTLFEYSVQAAAALSSAFLKDGNRVALLIYGWGIDCVFPGYGKIQQERILNSLARAQTGFNFALETLSNLPNRFFPSGSQLVYISPLQQNDVPILIKLHQHGYSILVISPNPVENETTVHSTDSRRKSFAVRINRLERELQFLRLRQGGVRVIDWPLDQPFDRIIGTSFLHRQNTQYDLHRGSSI